MKRFYVIGNPIKHSKSPQIHAMFARQCGLEIEYGLMCFEVGAFAESLDALRGGEPLCGANVTVPFKLDAANYAEVLTERAAKAGAVNTLAFDGEKVVGDNTDGIGFVNDLQNRCGFSFAGKRVLILGAGGATRGLLAVLCSMDCRAIDVANRTKSKAEVLAADFGCGALSLDEVKDAGYDIVINATSAAFDGSAPAIDPVVYGRATVAYDLYYAKEPTPFMRAATENGCPVVVDGLGMLVEQAAESFALWLGVRPDTDPVYARLKSDLQQS